MAGLGDGIEGTGLALNARGSTKNASPTKASGSIKGPGEPKESFADDDEDIDVNSSNTKLFGDFLRKRLQSCLSPKPSSTKSAALAGVEGSYSREMTQRAFRHLRRGQGHILTFAEFKEGLGGAFGGQMPATLIKATFDLFDSEPRTWQLDFDEFCAWLDSGKRVLDRSGLSNVSDDFIFDAAPAPATPEDGRRRGSNSSVGLARSNSSVGLARLERRMSLEQEDRAQHKAHLMKHKHKLYKAKLTDAQKVLIDLMLLESIKAKTISKAKDGKFDVLTAFQLFTRGKKMLGLPAFLEELQRLMPHLKDGKEAKAIFARMDNNGDGAIDLTDFMMWVQRGSNHEAGTKTDWWALEEDEHLRALKDTRRGQAANPLVPDDYDGSTWIAKLNRQKNNDELTDARKQEHLMKGMELRKRILGKVKGGSAEILKALRHFRPAAANRKLFVEYSEFCDSLRQRGMNLTASDLKEIFAHFDLGSTGEIDYTEFRLWLLGEGMHAVAAPTAYAGNDALRNKILAKVKSDKEVLKAFRTFKAPDAGRQLFLDKSHLNSSLEQMGLKLSPSNLDKLFVEFDHDGSGSIDFMEFRKWLLGKDMNSTGLTLGDDNHDHQMMQSAKDRAEKIYSQPIPHSTIELHQLLRDKIQASISAGPLELLRAFRRVTRKSASVINYTDFAEAIKSFGMRVSADQSRELFDLYDRKCKGKISFQDFVELVIENPVPPSSLTTAEKETLAQNERLGPTELSKLVTDLRAGLWKMFETRPHECFAAMDRKAAGVITVKGIREGLKLAGIPSNSLEDRAMEQVLQTQKVQMTGKSGKTPSWDLASFMAFYRVEELKAQLAKASAAPTANQPAEFAEEIAAARRPSTSAGSTRAPPSTARSSMGIEDRMRMAHGKAYSRWRHLLRTFQQLDPKRTGIISVKDFHGVLRMSNTSHKLSQAEVKQLLKANKCQKEGGQIDYASFLKGMLALMKAKDPSAASLSRPGTAMDMKAGSKPGLRRSKSLDPAAASEISGYVNRLSLPGSAIRATTAASTRSRTGSRCSLPQVLSMGVAHELPKTSDLHRAMKQDVLRVLKPLSRDLKKKESPYRRGVVSLGDFEESCHRNGLNLSNNDMQQLLKSHRHKAKTQPGEAGWADTHHSAAAGFDEMPVNYKEFLQTVASATAVPVSMTAPMK